MTYEIKHEIGQEGSGYYYCTEITRNEGVYPYSLTEKQESSEDGINRSATIYITEQKARSIFKRLTTK